MIRENWTRVPAQREQLPSKRKGYTQRFSIGGQTVYLHTGEYPDGRLGEIFIDAAKTGTLIRALLNAIAMAVSRGLQYGIPLQDYVAMYKEFHFHPCGEVEGDSRILSADSILSYVFEELERTYIFKQLPEPQPPEDLSYAVVAEQETGTDVYEACAERRINGEPVLDQP